MLVFVRSFDKGLLHWQANLCDKQKSSRQLQFGELYFQVFTERFNIKQIVGLYSSEQYNLRNSSIF